MTEVTGIIIPSDDDLPIQKVTWTSGDYKYIQGVVAGVLDCIAIRALDMTIFVHGESKTLGMPVNMRATALMFMDSLWRDRDLVAGDAFIAGMPDDEGETQSAPEELMKLLFNTSE